MNLFKMNREPLLSIENLSVDFTGEHQTTHAVKNVSLHVHRGEILALVGESGSGKSVTSLSILKLLPQPPAKFSSGKILFNNDNGTVELLSATSSTMQKIRGNNIGMIFQEPMTSLNPVMSCGKQVMEALLTHLKISRTEAKKKTIDWFNKVKLPDAPGIFNRFPHQLSGGQKQRVMIAMAMCCHPALLICDEPTTALDVTVQKVILQLIRELQQEQDMGVIFITHDLGVVADIADRVAIMYKGEIVEQNDVRTIFKSPQHPYTQALIACRPAGQTKGRPLPTVAQFIGEKKEDLGTRDHLSGIQFSEKTQTQKTSLVDVRNLSVRFPSATNLFGKTKSYFTAVDNFFNLAAKSGILVSFG